MNPHKLTLMVFSRIYRPRKNVATGIKTPRLASGGLGGIPCISPLRRTVAVKTGNLQFIQQGHYSRLTPDVNST